MSGSSSNNDIDNKNKGGRPTTGVVADREWGLLIQKMKAKAPALMMKALNKYDTIMDNAKASESAVLRAASGTFDIIKYLHDLDKKVAEEDARIAEEEGNAQGLLAAVGSSPKSATISLEAFRPEENKLM